MVARGGHAWLLQGGVHGCSGGCMVAPGGWGGMRGFFGGACVVFLGGMHGFFPGVCVVFSGGCAWFFPGGHA